MMEQLSGTKDQRADCDLCAGSCFQSAPAADEGLSHMTLPAPALYQGRQSLPLQVLDHQPPHVPLQTNFSCRPF